MKKYFPFRVSTLSTKWLNMICALVFIIPAKVCQSQEINDSLLIATARVYRNLSEALQNKDSVYILDLSKQKFATIPADVFLLTNLRILKMEKCKLQSINSEIEKLTLLHELNLANNKIVVITPKIGTLKNLKVLNLNRNLIEEIPIEIGNLRNLRELYMWDNELSIFPNELKQLSALKIFELRGILIDETDQQRIKALLPDCKVMMSPSCNCKTY
nr:leucine-rich repeat domain-containing protein [Bacteroidota bacterium]